MMVSTILLRLEIGGVDGMVLLLIMMILGIGDEGVETLPDLEHKTMSEFFSLTASFQHLTILLRLAIRDVDWMILMLIMIFNADNDDIGVKR